eukprot:TRINITY_DN3766_c0_g1_i2.p2 TRINITY_DN3766_c0_g1~~TRINITY_DN3766_c0_g1_i2.p2  ORF type:complete len:203 (-),score=4.88 TRINITY_DN3766_c0_g1_i2:508-1116(-)
MVLKGLFSDAGARQHPGDEQMNSPSLLMYMCPFSIVWLVPFVIQKEPGALLTTLTRIGNSPEFAMLFIINVVSAYLANLFNFFNYEVIGCAFVVSIGEFKRGSRGHSQRIVVQKSDYPLGGYRVYVNYDWCVCLQRSSKIISARNGKNESENFYEQVIINYIPLYRQFLRLFQFQERLNFELSRCFCLYRSQKQFWREKRKK